MSTKFEKSEFQLVAEYCKKEKIITRLIESHIKLDARKLEYDYLMIKGKLLQCKLEIDPKESTQIIEAKDIDGKKYVIYIEEVPRDRLGNSLTKILKNQWILFKDEVKPNFDRVAMILEYRSQRPDTVAGEKSYYLLIEPEDPSDEIKITLESELLLEREKVFLKSDVRKISELIQLQDIRDFLRLTESLIAITEDDTRRKVYESERMSLKNLECKVERKYEIEMEVIQKDIQETRERIANFSREEYKPRKKEKDGAEGPSLAEEIENQLKHQEPNFQHHYKIGKEKPRSGFFRRILNFLWDFFLPQDRKVSELISKLERQRTNEEQNFKAEDYVTLIELEERRESARLKSTKDKINMLIETVDQKKYNLMKNFLQLNSTQERQGFLNSYAKEMDEILNNRLYGGGIPYSSRLGEILRELENLSSKDEENKQRSELLEEHNLNPISLFLNMFRRNRSNDIQVGAKGSKKSKKIFKNRDHLSSS